MSYFIGVDLGGTNVRVAKVNSEGSVLQVIKEATEIEKGVDHVFSKLCKMIESLDGYEECLGIGLGVPGPVDTEEGKMIIATNLPGFEGYPIAKKIQDYFKKPTYIDNDANVAGLGEALQGAGKGNKICYYVTISTGIGGALIADGKVIAGKNGHAGEIGNIIIDRNREKVNFLNVGAVENEASGTAVTRKGKELLGEGIQNAGDVFKLAEEGDEVAIKIVDEMAYDLAVMFSVIAHVVDPSCFILGGGVMKSKKVFMDKVEANFRNMIHKGMQTVVFKDAVLDEPGIVGAASLPMSYIKV